MTFASREDAGMRLGQLLIEQGVRADIVLGLPRGGVVVAEKVAGILSVPLDVIVVRKIGHPQFREFAVGALAEGDVVVLDHGALEKNHVLSEQLQMIIDEEKERLHDYRHKFHLSALPDLNRRSALIIDDGLATGATMEAAVRAARERGAREVLVAVPVASNSAVDRLQRVADRVLAVLTDPTFDAVGRYYDHFGQTTDEEVIASLRRAEQAMSREARRGFEGVNEVDGKTGGL